MRPIQLTMQAFASYGQKTTIDFTKPDQSLFLITGDTGAGKTTIFDAIVFALYGQASSTSNKKDGLELQSQFAQYTVTPFVELSFSDGSLEKECLYTVRRVPRHVRPLKKGSGVKEERETVSLILPDGTEYAHNRQETNEKLEEIVGLTQSQFMQVAMIAQGEFMELLRADSNKKKEIFRKLFNTEVFQNIVNELDQRRKMKIDEMKTIRTACQTEVGHIIIPENSQYRETLAAVKDRILNAEQLNAADMDLLLELLGNVCADLADAQETAEKICDEASLTRDQARDDYHQGKILKDAFDQLDRANDSIAECVKAEQLIQQKTKLIDTIHHAYEIQAVYLRLFDAEKLMKETVAKLENLEEKLPELKAEAEAAAAAETKVRDMKEQQLSNFTAVSERVEKALEGLRALQAAENQVVEKQALWVNAKDYVQKTKVELQNFERELSVKRIKFDELSEAKLSLSRWEANAQEAEALESARNNLSSLYLVIQDQKEKLNRAKQTYIQCRQQHLEKNREYEQKRDAFLDAQAGFLAKEKLHPGQPCPVCGALEHPAPRPLSEENQNLTRSYIDQLSQDVRALLDQREMAAALAKSAEEVLSEKQTQYSQAEQQFRSRIIKNIQGILPDASVQELGEALDEWKMDLHSMESQLRRQVEEYERIQSFLQHTSETETELKNAADTANTACADAQAALMSCQATRDSLQKQMIYATREDAIAARNNAKSQKISAELKYNAAHQYAMTANSHKEEAQTRLRQLQESLPEQQAEWDQRKNAYIAILDKYQMQQFQWKKITEQHEKTEISLLQNEIQTHIAKKSTANGMRDAALRTIADRPRPIINQLLDAFSCAQRKWEICQGERDMIRQMHKANQGTYKALAPKMQERSCITKEYSKIDTLYRRLAGKETGSRMDIETYVQRYYLQRILYAANVRFQEMSAGQFELRMTSEESSGAGKNRGLDLMVYSAVTGKEREVRTLSGGESFMAALSLALGMADQIQESSAAVHLDMMFIDEGFGSLDAHSREQAVKVLQRMAGGSKLIGIISHVTELKHSIEDQLIIRKDETGSHPHWVIS